MLNYKHLYYFREVATTGSIARASERLHLTPQTISGQLSLLEESFGAELFKKNGRNLELTEAGQMALKYADEIFQAGAELEDAMLHYPLGQARILRVGVSDVLPKAIAYRLLQPALNNTVSTRIVCIEGSLPDLLAQLAVHRLELVLADSPIPPTMNVRGFSHELGSSTVSFFAHNSLLPRLQGEFPDCLNQAPLLIPTEGSSVRRKLRQWFHEQRIHPTMVGEFDDSALMQAFGAAGTGVFPAPSALEQSLTQEGQLQVLGRVDSVSEQFFAISAEKRITHSAVKAITENAEQFLQKKHGNK